MIRSIHTLAVFLASVASALAGWSWTDPLPQGNTLFSASYSPEQDAVVAIGELGSVVRKVGGAPWESVPAFTDGTTFDSVLWANDRFIAVGGGAGVWTSSNGTGWAAGQVGVTGTSIAGTSGQVVILSGNSVWVSSDPAGAVWTLVPLPTTPPGASYRALAFLGGVFVAVGDQGIVARSTDGGQTWTGSTNGAGADLYSLVAGNGKFVAAGWTVANNGSFTPYVLHSADGQTWTQGTVPTPPAGNYFYTLVAAASRFIAGGVNGNFVSTDGAAWTPVVGGPQDFVPIGSVEAGVLGSVIVGNRGGIFRFDESQTWTAQTTGAITGTYLWPPRFSAAGLGTVVLAKDDNRSAPAIYRSVDGGNSWTEQAVLPPFLQELSGLQKIDDRIVGYSAAGNPPGFYGTADGIQWQLMSEAGLEGSVVALAASDGEQTLVALTHELVFDAQSSLVTVRRLYRSTSWGTWARVSLSALNADPPQSGNLETLAWDGNRFVMLLHPGRVLTSVDGLSWLELPPLPQDSPATLAAYLPANAPAANTVVSVASNGSLLVARSEKISSSGSPGAWHDGRVRFFIFRDGVWQENALLLSERSRDLYQVSWDGNRFLAPVPGRLLTSTDGIVWTSREVGASLASIVLNASNLVGFSTEAAALAHPDGLSPGTDIPYTAVTPSVRVVPASGEAFNVGVASTEASWSASSSVTWLSVSPSSGVGNGTVGVTAQQNSGSAFRSGTVQVAGASLLITQQPGKAYQPKVASVNGGSLSIPFSGAWSAVVDQTWATFSTSGVNGATGSGNVQVRFAPNPSAASRTAIVTVNGVAIELTQAGNTKPKPSVYYGAVGSVLPLLLNGSNQNLAPSLQWVGGSLAITVGLPSTKSPNGSYSAVLNVFDGTVNRLIRAKGNMGPGSTLQDVIWSTGGKTPITVEVSLAPLDNGDGSEGLAGSLKIADQDLDILVGRQIFDKKTNPWPVDALGNSFTMALHNVSVLAGTGAGTVVISPLGVAKTVVRLGDGTSVTMSAPVWSATGAPDEKILFLHAPLAKNSGYFGGWAVCPNSPTENWTGSGTWSLPGEESTVDVEMYPYTKPAAKASPLSWIGNSAVMQVYNPDFLDLAGDVFFTPPTKFNVVSDNPNVSVKLKIKATTGLVSGQISYFPLEGFIPKKTNAKLYGVLDQATGIIHGLVVFTPTKSGVLEILP